MMPADVYRAFLETGKAWADAHGAAELLESSLKSLEAQLTLEAKGIEKCSQTEAKSIALSSDTYREYAKKAIAARTEANRARVKYDSTKALWEATRTKEASERAAMHAAP